MISDDICKELTHEHIRTVKEVHLYFVIIYQGYSIPVLNPLLFIVSDNNKTFFNSCSLGLAGGELDENECRDNIRLHKDEVKLTKQKLF